MTQERVSYVISVMAQDRLGIIADVSEALYGIGGNLEALSQTVMQGWFTMIMLTTFPEGVAAGDIEAAVKARGDYRLTVAPHTPALAAPAVEGDPFVVTVIGGDRTGIVYRLARRCSKRGVNIEDVWNEVQDGRFILIFKAIVPADVDHKDLRYELEGAAAELGVALHMQHQDVFTATNSLNVHTPD